MSDDTTRKEILDLLARGKLTVEEAAELLSRDTLPEPTAVPEQPPKPEEPVAEQIVIEEEEPPLKTAVVEQVETSEATNGERPNWLRVRVRNLATGKNKVTVNIPVGMVQFGLRVANKFTPEEEIDFEGMADMIASGQMGTIVEVEDEESNEHVLVYLD